MFVLVYGSMCKVLHQLHFFVCFFFKQKTAYEMESRGWSSDVCSSDLEQIFEGKLSSLKRFKDDVKEVKAGFECGLVFEGFDRNRRSVGYVD